MQAPHLRYRIGYSNSDIITYINSKIKLTAQKIRTRNHLRFPVRIILGLQAPFFTVSIQSGENNTVFVCIGFGGRTFVTEHNTSVFAADNFISGNGVITDFCYGLGNYDCINNGIHKGIFTDGGQRRR